MTVLLVGGYGPDAGGTAEGLGWATFEDGVFAYRGVLVPLASPSWLTVRGDRVVAALESSDRVALLSVSDAAPSHAESHAEPLVEPIGAAWSGGHAPCHVAIVGDEVVVANYVDGRITVLAGGDDEFGDLVARVAGEGSGPLPAQAGPHAHAALAHPSGDLLTADLGADRVHVLRQEDGHWVRSAAIPFPPGTGPRDLLILDDGRVAVLGEWARDVHLLERGADSGTWRLGARCGLPGVSAGQAAGLVVSPDGATLYAGVRGPDVIASVRVDGRGMRPGVAIPCGGSWPRHLVVVDGHLLVSLQLANAVAVFRILPSGALDAVDPPIAAPSPTCLATVGV